ncbi:MAG TPA: hypothetical protein VL125_15890 [Pelobium sp.]|nr:hypothetical protein [Pelobium sp.]
MNFKNLKNYLFVAAAASIVFTSCKKDNPSDEVVVKGETVLSGQITGVRTLSADTVYLLRSYVRVMANGTLNIPEGTIIKGEKATKGALIVERGGKIYARGTSSKPIVFTSDQAADSRNIGDWSGVIICGNAKVNTASGTATYEGGVLGAGVADYGGTNDADNSGIFKYVRIEFAGIAIEKDKEINGLTLCAVGSGTELNHIQVSYSGDDSYEWFGGTVNATHLIAYRGTDDDFDMDQGFTGKMQYGVSIKDPNVADLVGTSRSIELETKGTPSPADFVSRPVLSNFTFIGPGSSSLSVHGATVHFGLNSKMVLANSIMLNARTNAVEINSEVTAGYMAAGTSLLTNNMVFGTTANYGLSSVTTAFADAAAFATFAGTKGNFTVNSLAAAGITSTNIDSPVLTLASSSAANGKATFTGDLTNSFFKSETFIGAMGTTDWTSGWANWSPKTTVY